MNDMKQENFCTCKRCQVLPPNPFCCDQHMIQGSVLYTSCDFKRRNGLDCRAFRTAPQEPTFETDNTNNHAHICRECKTAANQRKQLKELQQESKTNHCKHLNQKDVQKYCQVKEQAQSALKEEAFSSNTSMKQTLKNCHELNQIHNRPQLGLPIRCNGLSREFSSNPSMYPSQNDILKCVPEKQQANKTCPLCKPPQNKLLNRDNYSVQSESAPRLCVSSGHKHPNLRDQQNSCNSLPPLVNDNKKSIISCSNCYVIDTQNIVQAPKVDGQTGTDFTSKFTPDSKIFPCKTPKTQPNFSENLEGFGYAKCRYQ